MRKIIDWFDFIPDEFSTKLFRIGLSMVTILHFAIFLPHTKLLYTDQGILSDIQAQNQTNGFSLLFFFHNPLLPYILIIIGIISCLTSLNARFANFSFLIAYITLLSINNRMLIAGYGGLQILLCMLLFSTFVPFTPNSPWPWRGWAIRVIQIQFCMVYFFSALEKIRNQFWYYGEALLQISYDQLSIWPGVILIRNPFFAFFGNYYTIFFELLFPILIWTNFPRRYLLLGGLIFHLMILATISAVFFPFVMLVNLTLFLTNPNLEQSQHTANTQANMN
jgi:hypothetical protein